MLDKETVIKIQDSEYVVVFSTMYNNENYVFLTNVDLPGESAFYKVGNDSHLELVKDNATLAALLNIYKEQNNL